MVNQPAEPPACDGALPLWCFSGLVTLLYVFAASLGPIAMNLLYGDAVAVQVAMPVGELLEA